MMNIKMPCKSMTYKAFWRVYTEGVSFTAESAFEKHRLL